MACSLTGCLMRIYSRQMELLRGNFAFGAVLTVLNGLCAQILPSGKIFYQKHKLNLTLKQTHKQKKNPKPPKKGPTNSGHE